MLYVIAQRGEFMNLKKRMIALVLSVAMVLTYMPAVVFAEGSADYGYTPSAEETAAKEERDAAQAKYDAAKAAHELQKEMETLLTTMCAF